MVNFVPAKCPDCDALIELDDNMKRAECNYCGRTIVVDDAIARYEKDVLGIIDGIETLKTEEEEGKVIDYDGLLRALEEALRDDPFNHDAICEWLKATYKKNEKSLSDEIINYDAARVDAREVWPLVERIVEQYDKLKKLDENQLYKNKIGELLTSFDYLTEQYNLLVEDEKKLKGYFDEFKDLLSYDSDEYLKALNLFYHMMEYNVPSSYKPNVSNLTLHRNGKLEEKSLQDGRYVSTFKVPSRPDKRLSRYETFDNMEKFMSYLRNHDYSSYYNDQHKESRKQVIGKITGLFKKD